MKTEAAGRIFGRLKVLKDAGIDKHGAALWMCVCACGEIAIVRGGNLRSGHTKSCGCLSKEIFKKATTIHGLYGSPEYKSWNCMIQRCCNPNATQFIDYGGRGIKVCTRWLKFENFFEDMGDRPEGKTIDRFPNNDGNYEHGNCRWATRSEQTKNQRLRKTNKTGVTGVSWNSQKNKYVASICINYKQLNLGYFRTIEKAIIARKQAEQLYFSKKEA